MSPRKLLDDCFLHDGQRLRHADAVTTITARLSAVTATEEVPLAEATGRHAARTGRGEEMKDE